MEPATATRYRCSTSQRCAVDLRQHARHDWLIAVKSNRSFGTAASCWEPQRFFAASSGHFEPFNLEAHAISQLWHSFVSQSPSRANLHSVASLLHTRKCTASAICWMRRRRPTMAATQEETETWFLGFEVERLWRGQCSELLPLFTPGLDSLRQHFTTA